MTDIIINGKPLVVFTFDLIPSWNDVIAWSNMRPKNARSPKQARVIFESRVGEWRRQGEELAQSFMETEHSFMEYLIDKRAFVLVKAIRGTERKYDVHNVWLKAILDGFSDGKIWPDDEWPNVPIVTGMWWPKDEQGQRFEIEIHELGRFMYNGQIIPMPQGRIERPKKVRR